VNTGTDFAESRYDIMELLYQNLPGLTEKNQEIRIVTITGVPENI
jgi:hypothetical protein